MRRFFHKSAGLILFAATVSLVLSFGTALARAVHIATNGDFQDRNLVIVLAASLALLLLLNAVDIIEFWLRGRLQELNVKRILGISRANIYFPLYRDLNLLILLSFVLGIGLTAGASALLSPVYKVSLGAVDLLLSLGFCLIFLNLFCTLLVPRALRKCAV